ncbi:MAG TPA: DUF2779 domain-containing protein [Alphaproteobacteria bacterium]|nr:DUF2779 domain-containing protein [Alphaproteobacteria bacterium]
MITKTFYTESQRCKLYGYLNNTIGPNNTVGLQFRKDEGDKVGELAKKLYPEGVDLVKYSNTEKIQQTKNLRDKVLFEATAVYDNLFARADILVPNNDGTYNLIEVKADSYVKEDHIVDVSFQKHVFDNAGYHVKNSFVAYTNKEFVRNGEIDPHKYFKLDDVTSKIVPVDASGLKKELPEHKIGRHCISPNECPHKDRCWAHLPHNNVTQLFYDKKTGFELMDKGIILIKDIESLVPKGQGAKQREIQLAATKGDYVHIEAEEIRKFLDIMIYPINYLDFETYGSAVPLFDSYRPWQRVPFQYSLHIEHSDGSVVHKEFLATERTDPRESLIDSLNKDLTPSGSIVVYNEDFEKSLLKELGKDFSSLDVNGLLPRIVDLALPFEKFHYYNPKQEGKYSIKTVLETLTNLSYKGLAIKDGEEAYCAYEKIINGIDRDRLIPALREYCKLDTLAELEITKKLREI